MHTKPFPVHQSILSSASTVDVRIMKALAWYNTYTTIDVFRAGGKA